ncbi:hypothetical protein HDU97_008274 [Phlyctochytrium planicorne]|nr:hypothetical protein HDU97_008274 [Phlyctochytrium planicorne]
MVTDLDLWFRLRWDEDNLMMTEAQKSSTMKITEPKTPFIHYNHETDEILGNTGSVPPLELSTAISSAKGLMSLNSEDSLISSDSERRSTASSVKSTSDWESDEDETLTEEEKAKRAKFAKLRSQHYNMKAALQKAKSKPGHGGRGGRDDDDDDEEEDEHEGRGHGIEDDEDDDEGDELHYEEDTDHSDFHDYNPKSESNTVHSLHNASSSHGSFKGPKSKKHSQSPSQGRYPAKAAASPSDSDPMRGYTSEESDTHHREASIGSKRSKSNAKGQHVNLENHHQHHPSHPSFSSYPEAVSRSSSFSMAGSSNGSHSGLMDTT